MYLIFKNVKIYLLILIVILVLVKSVNFYIDFLQNKEHRLLDEIYKEKVYNIKQSVASMISQKQKSTLALAITISQNRHVLEDIISGKINSAYYEKLLKKLSDNTLYKNIWIHIMDKDGVSLYRSWSSEKGDNVAKFRQDLSDVIKEKKIHHSISSGKYDLTFKAMVPIFESSKFLGVIEIISHFNSISKELKKAGIQAVVVLNKKDSKKIIHPFTKIYIGDNYVANLDAPLSLRNYLQKYGVNNFYTDTYRLDNSYLITSYPLTSSLDNRVIAHIIMFKKISTLSKSDSDFFIFKWVSISLMILMGLIIVAVIILFYKNRKQKIYYKNIIDSSTNIVLINNGKSIINVNNAFFKYFSMYKTLDDFKKEHECICDFFKDEDGYLTKKVESMGWVEYIIKNPDKTHKAKLEIVDKIYFFIISASMVSKEYHHYSIIFSDITKEENYKEELEYLTVTDPLTGVGNRRYFNVSLKNEINDAHRYKYPLSLIMFDIDFFKQVNDTHGHDIGDEVLKEYTKLISKLLRSGDEFCRIGGEEFIVILPHSNIENALKIADKLRCAVERHKKILPITMSFGVVEYEEGEEFDTLFKRADDALYRAKENGRNRVELG